MGLICQPLHQLFHLFQALWYVVVVPLLHPAASNWEVSSEIPSVCCLRLITSRRLVVIALLQSGGVGCWTGLSITWGSLGVSGENPLTILVMAELSIPQWARKTAGRVAVILQISLANYSLVDRNPFSLALLQAVVICIAFSSFSLIFISLGSTKKPRYCLVVTGTSTCWLQIPMTPGAMLSGWVVSQLLPGLCHHQHVVQVYYEVHFLVVESRKYWFHQFCENTWGTAQSKG